MPSAKPPLSRRSSSITFPSVRIKRRSLVVGVIILLACIIAAVDTLRDFIINERALLTSRGRERHRTRRRINNKTRLCDETDEPKLWKVFTGWRSLSSCMEYDLSLRRKQLGDGGVLRLVSLLGRKEYATRHRRGKLRVLNLQHQGITRRGAGYLARWLSVDPIDVDDNDKENAELELDIDRLPTAAFRSIFINLEGNPIGLLGVKDLERAVDKARINGIRAVIVGGGSSSDTLAKKGVRTQHHVVKLGPIEYTRKSVEMPAWRLPVSALKRANNKLKDNPILPSLKGILMFVVGVLVGRLSVAVNLIPYRLSLVRSDG